MTERHIGTHDLVPQELRKKWRHEGRYPGKSIFAAFREQRAGHPDRAAVIDERRAVSYDELFSAACGLAQDLRDQGVRPGEVVAIQLPNIWEACAADLAVAAVGAISLPFPPGRGSREAASLLTRSRAVAVVIQSSDGQYDYARMIDGLQPTLPDLRACYVHGEDRPGFTRLEACLDGSTEPAFTPVDVDPDSPGRILVTSGSEAEPKMVLYSHNALLGGRGAFMEAIRGGTHHMNNLFLPPLGSSFGSLGTTVTLSRVGGTLVLVGKFQAETALRAIKQHGVTHVFAVPAMLQMMLASPELAGEPFSSLVAVVSGGSRIDRSTIQACARRLGGRFVNLYGSADGVNCYNDLDDSVDRMLDTVGRPNPAITSIRIVDEKENDVDSGQVGEIWSRGPMSPMCYVNSPQLDAAYRSEDGWVKTGDLGRFDREGYLVVVGRQKDVIVRGGRNISPVEIELLLARHPSIAQAACVGVYDARLGERVCACVVLRPGELPVTLEQINAFLLVQGLEQGKLPEFLEILPALPLGPAGKVAKKSLSEWLTLVSHMAS